MAKLDYSKTPKRHVARPDAPRAFAARYKGTCDLCADTFKPGAMIYWFKSPRRTYHAACYGKEAR